MNLYPRSSNSSIWKQNICQKQSTSPSISRIAKLLEETLSDRIHHKWKSLRHSGNETRISRPGENNAKHSFEQRFRVLKPTSKAITEALQNALNLAEEPKRIESFDISHTQGTDTVASMVVWKTAA